MDIMQLQYFQMVARLEHMTRAADQLHITQPSLSKTISRLEEGLGVQLFDREGNKIKLNCYGKAFLERVDEILYLLDFSAGEIREMAGLEQGSVSIVSGQTNLLHIPTSRFLQKYTNALVNHRIINWKEMLGALDERATDFAIISEGAVTSAFDWEPALDMRLFVHLSENHPLAGNKTVSLSQLSGMNFIRTGMGYSIPEELMRKFEAYGFRPRIVYDGNDIQTVGYVVDSGVAASLLNPIDYRNILMREHCIPGGRALLITEPDASWRLGIASSRNHHFSRAALEYRKYLREYFAELNAELSQMYAEFC